MILSYEKEFKEMPRNLFPNLRKKSYEDFLNQGFPTKKSEAWRYTDLNSFLKKNLKPKINLENQSRPPEDLINSLDSSHYLLFFQNGQFIKDLSTFPSEKDALIKKWSDLTEEDIKSCGHLNFQKLENLISDFKIENIFSKINSAFFMDGLFIYIKNKLERPLHIIYLSSEENYVLNIKNILFLSEEAEASVCETHLESSKDLATNTTTNIYLSKKSKLSFFKSQRQNEESLHFSQTQVKLFEKSFFNAFFLSSGGLLSKQEVICEHCEENAVTQMNGLYLCKNSQHADFSLNVEHNKAFGKSHQLFKGILNDSSTAAFNGRIYIAPKAQKVDSSLNNKNLILSPLAQVNVKPELEIYADDVKAAHGATTASLSDEEIFYLSSRGLTPLQAKKILTVGFSKDTLSNLEGSIKKEAWDQTYEELKKILETSSL